MGTGKISLFWYVQYTEIVRKEDNSSVVINCQRYPKGLIENLRTATNRCDQISILAVLLLYIEQVSSDRLFGLKENFNSYILDKLADLNKHPKSLMNQHSFLHDLDAMGHCIISLKPTKIICCKISLSLNISIDFNLRDNSITLVAVSLTRNAVTFLAIVSRPKLKENLSVEHELKIRGSWSFIDNGANDTFHKRTSINVYLPIHDRNAIWKAKVKSLFRFVADTPRYSQSVSSQGNESTRFDRRLAQFALHSLDDRGYSMSPHAGSFDSFSMTCSQIGQKSIAPIARKQLDADVNISVFGVDRTNVPATKVCIESPSAIESKAEDDGPADLPIHQEEFDPFLDRRNESLYDPVDGPQDDPLDDQLSDHSSGISLVNDVSVMDDSLTEMEMDGNVKGFGASSQRSGFSSIDSSFSEIDKQVRRFVAGTENRSAQHTSQPHTDGNAAIARLTDSIRNIMGTTSKASNDRPNEEKTKSSSPNDCPLEQENSLKSQPVPPTGIEHAEKDEANAIQMQDRSISTSPSNLNSVKAYPSNDMLRNEKMDEPHADDITLAGSNHDEDDNDRTDESDAELEFDDEGMVFDKHGCIFVNSVEVEDALLVYIENDGLAYLKSRAFEAGNADRRQRSKREFRAIHKMIHRRFEDATYSPNHSFTYRETKRKLWTDFDDASIRSSQSGSHYQQPIKKHKRSEVLHKGTNACVANVMADREPNVDNGKLQAVSCALTQLNALIGYLKDFFETRKTCGMHRLQLLDLITKLQASNTMALSGEVKLLDYNC